MLDHNSIIRDYLIEHLKTNGWDPGFTPHYETSTCYFKDSRQITVYEKTVTIFDNKKFLMSIQFEDEVITPLYKFYVEH
jgi:hypothetical protein